ncbi:MAG: TIGR02221 family CRISPR-associated protein, partial [Rhodocyclaceae bacterium]|nr:TIGR02221 family CRISPR-associated protein [Rhodocyclaceae bacterium]
MTVQISFLGKARQDPKTGYRPTRYVFDSGAEIETAFFGPALAQVTRPSLLYILGTAGSMWDVLLESQGGELASDEARLGLWERAAAGTVDNDLLEQFEPVIGERLGVQCRLRVISYADTLDAQTELVSQLAGWLEPGQQVTLDVTHGLRHLPMLMLAAAHYLERLRGVKVEEIYYGAMEMSAGGKTPVLKLSGLLRLLDWVQAISAFERDGDYARLTPLLKADGMPEETVARLEDAAFYEQTTRPGQARGKIREFLKSTPELEGTSGLFFG